METQTDNGDYKPTLLALDDSTAELRLIQELFGSDYSVLAYSSLNDAKKAVDERTIDAAILDFNLGNSTAPIRPDLLEQFRIMENPADYDPAFNETSVPLMHYIREEKKSKMPIVLSSTTPDLEKIAEAFGALYTGKLHLDNYLEVSDYLWSNL